MSRRCRILTNVQDLALQDSPHPIIAYSEPVVSTLIGLYSGSIGDIRQPPGCFESLD